MRTVLGPQIKFPTINTNMKAAVFHKIGDISVANVPDPMIEEPDDIILKITSTSICGSDLHILMVLDLNAAMKSLGMNSWASWKKQVKN